MSGEGRPAASLPLRSRRWDAPRAAPASRHARRPRRILQRRWQGRFAHDALQHYERDNKGRRRTLVVVVVGVVVATTTRAAHGHRRQLNRRPNHAQCSRGAAAAGARPPPTGRETPPRSAGAAKSLRSADELLRRGKSRCRRHSTRSPEKTDAPAARPTRGAASSLSRALSRPEDELRALREHQRLVVAVVHLEQARANGHRDADHDALAAAGGGGRAWEEAGEQFSQGRS